MEKKDDLKSEVKSKVVKRFGSKPIGTRLLQSYAWVAGVIIAASILSVLSVMDGYYRLKKFDDVNLQLIDSAWESKQLLGDIQCNLYEVWMSKEESKAEQCIDNIQKAEELLIENLKEIRQLAPEEQVKLENIQNSMDEAKNQITEAILIAEDGEVQEAIQYLENEFFPLVDSINKEMELLVDKARTEAKEYVHFSMIRAIILAVLVAVVAISDVFLSMKLSRKIVKGITKPLQEVEYAMNEMASGNLDIQLEYKSKNEIGHLADSTREMSKELQLYIRNINSVLGEMSKKNFEVDITIEYKGVFQDIKNSMIKIINFLNEVMSSMSFTADNVSSGSANISEASMSLAEGATDQANAIQQLLTTVKMVSEQVDNNARNAQDVSEKANESQEVVHKGSTEMEELQVAMNEIMESSQKISNIIEVINSISDQTNLLALNASIEAARAGEEGKGFAIVANEIGQLASETNEATKTTAELIHQSLSAVTRGAELLNHTAQSLQAIVSSSEKITELAHEVSGASEMQTEALIQVDTAVQQIAEVAQNNAAIAEETAASSNELTTHATNLAKVLGEFHLKE